MSFSSNVKEELSKINNLSNKEQIKAELIGYLVSSNISIINNKQVKYSTESEYNINRFSKLLNNVGILNYQIEMQGKSFVIIFDIKQIFELIDYKDGKIHIKEFEPKEEILKSIVRGIFLGAGSINNPENKYHLEINLLSGENEDFVYDNMFNYGIKLKKIKIAKEYSLYLKDGEEISKFLAFIGANKAVIEFEEIRVKRDMNNKINRLVNCEAANLNKTINASIAQIEAIEYLKKINEFEKLEDNLKEIAQIRVENPNMPLSELGALLKEPVGKSGVNYRLKKIVEIANELK